jgi:DNA modification methylase
MPESVTDRCTKAHEYVFLFAHPDSGGRYYYDNEAVKEPSVQADRERNDRIGGSKYVEGVKHSDGGVFTGGPTRNKRSVWNVNPRPYSGSHFATWPPELVRPMVLAGCPAGGTVLDPFSGSGTTGMVALQEGRNYVGIDLNPDYLPLAMNRVQELPAPSNASDEERGDAFDLFSGG